MAKDIINLLEKVKKNSGLSLFFKNLWEDSNLEKFFFLHREQLLPFYRDESSEIKTILPLIFWTNTQKSMEKSVLEIFSHLEEAERQRSWEELRFEELLNEMKDVFAYYAIEFFRSNEVLKKLVIDEDFSFRKMKDALGDYKNINLDALKQIDIEKIPELNAAMKAITLRFLSTFDPTKFMETISRTTGILGSFFLEGINHQAKLLNLLHLEFSEYTSLINELYILKLINNFQTVFWCEHCLDSPQLLVTTSRIDPNHLKMKCLKCRKFMKVCAIYEIDDLLKDCILFKDGLLAVALAWLFDQRKIDCEFSVHNGYENDFICTTQVGKFLFECKMHLIPKDERSFEGQLKQDLIQLIKHVKALAEEGIHFETVYLVYNYDLDLSDFADEIDRILRHPKLEGDIERYNIEPISYLNIHQVLEEMEF